MILPVTRMSHVTRSEKFITEILIFASDFFCSLSREKRQKIKLVELNYQPISLYLPKTTIFNILLYIYLYLQITDINKPHELPRDQCKTEGLLKDRQIS